MHGKCIIIKDGEKLSFSVCNYTQYQQGIIKWTFTIVNKQIRRIVVPRPATTLTLKRVKGQGQGHGMASLERACHKDHACQISMLYL